MCMTKKPQATCGSGGLTKDLPVAGGQSLDTAFALL